MMSFVFTHSQQNEGADRIVKPNKQTKAKKKVNFKPKCRFSMHDISIGVSCSKYNEHKSMPKKKE